MNSYSYSKLDTYIGCPLFYKRQYVENRKRAPSPELDRGIEVHDCTAEYVNHLVSNGLKTDLDFVRSLGVSLEAREILETFATTHLFEPGEGVYQVEKKHTIFLGDTKVEWTGVMDLVENRSLVVFITDYKTFWRALSQAEVNNHLQLKGYAVLAASMFPEAEQIVCRMDFPRLGVTREVAYLREDLPEIEQDLLRRIEQVRNDAEFKARPGTRCAWCSWTDSCPAIAAGDLEIIKSPDDAERSASQLVVLKARVKYLEDQLKPYCTKEGAISVNGMVVGYQTVHSASYELRALMDILEGLDYEPLDYLRPDATAIKKIAKKDEKLAADLALIEQDKSSSRFEVKKGETS